VFLRQDPVQRLVDLVDPVKFSSLSCLRRRSARERARSSVAMATAAPATMKAATLISDTTAPAMTRSSATLPMIMRSSWGCGGPGGTGRSRARGPCLPSGAECGNHAEAGFSLVMMDIRIVVVEDHALVREGTTELLEREPGCVVAGQAGSAEEALQLIRDLRPEVALVDVELPGMNGIALARAVAEQVPDTRVIILSAYDDYAYIIGALEAGVSGYLLKTATARELGNAVRTAASGALVLDEAI
jgi:CheY-like chemotaxis protein